MGDKKRKLLLTLLVVGVLGSVAGFGTYSAFTATLTNSGNSFASGTVKIEDASGLATALFGTNSNQAPNVAVTKCIRVQYTGSLAASVRFYMSAAITSGDKFTVFVERAVGGTGLSNLSTRGDCTNFGNGGTVTTAFASADIGTFPDAYADPAVDGKASGAAWNQNDWVDYRFTITTKDGSTPNDHTTAASTGSFSITWEARNN